MRSLAIVALALLAPPAVVADDVINVDARHAGQPFPHFWEKMFGSGRAILTLRAGYRQDLRDVRRVTGFGYVRFHNILHDEVGVYDEDDAGNPVLNFSYVDQIYDGLLENGVRPMVELSFMPRKLALRQDVHPFWYRQIVSPPKDYAKWDTLIRALAQHLVERYGIGEVAQWYFEVWNEPNIDFWSGEPKQATYFELYDHTARALKAVSPRLRVGGPASSSAHWVDDFLKHVSEAGVPVDFVSSHAYGDDTVEDLFGTHDDVPMDERVCRSIAKVRRQIDASPRPGLPLMWTEWNVPSFYEQRARDTAYVGAALADDILQCDGLVDMLAFWTFSDVFEESGPGRAPFEGMFGLRALGGIRKPSFTAFALLHRLGDRRLPAEGRVLATRRADGTLAIALWNLVDPDQPPRERVVRLRLRGLPRAARVMATLIDDQHASSLAAYRRMGSPRYPTRTQVAAMNRAAELPASSRLRAEADGSFVLHLASNALVLVEATAP